MNKLVLDLPMNDYLFCRLPHSSYHVTVNDLIHEGNLKDFSQGSRLKITAKMTDYDDCVLKHKMGMSKESGSMETSESSTIKKEIYSCNLKRKGLSITSKIQRIKERQNDKLIIKKGCY